ncbi:hypothetical protein [Microbacterium sp. 179-I 3D4 NHS]|uniref:hypothetical protein n=1 Tax=Microbacterium sp. 179-I 3D4 NHS TaxID=3142381 RepID=UPI0039A2506D
MDRTAKITTVVAAAAVAGLIVLAAPAVLGAASWMADAVAPAAASTPDASPTPSAEPATDDDLVDLGDGILIPAGGPGDCTTTARINIMSHDVEAPHAKLLGDLVEMGPSDLARGAVITDDAGAILAYEVAPGDSLIAIGERFCVDYVTVDLYNHVRVGMIHPGDVLYLRPDPSLPWVDPYMPFDVQPGEHTGPYYDAIDAMKKAVAARDLAAARSVWASLGPDVHPDARTRVDQALSASDWSLLRQMFP